MDIDVLGISLEESQAIRPQACLNINVGVLGHVDSGKTSICRVLSDVASTAALDKNPQSQQRGITLDLGFSAFVTRTPLVLQPQIPQPYLQFTLVDCPGHASLIRTIIGGAQIIDLMFLVIDAVKGIQTQTAECIVIAELFIDKMIVVLNKVDLCEGPQAVQKKIKTLRKIFAQTKFGADLVIVPFSTKESAAQHTQKLKRTLVGGLRPPQRDIQGKFSMLIDHCFKIKGKGTIITGTIVSGRVKIGDQIEICSLGQKSKVKGIEIFRKPLNSAKQGDRIAMLMHHLEAENIERDIACTPNSLQRIRLLVIEMQLIAPFVKKRPIKNKGVYHIINGHQTVMGELRLFSSEKNEFSAAQTYVGLSELDQTCLIRDETTHYFCLIELEKDFYSCLGSKVVGYKGDIQEEKACRIAFHGSIVAILQQNYVLKLKKEKVKTGVVDRVVDDYTIIVKDLFSKQVNLAQFIGQKVYLQEGTLTGKIDGAFGNAGKIRVVFSQSIAGLQLVENEVSFTFRKNV